MFHCFFFFFSSRRRHTRLQGDWEFRRVLFRSIVLGPRFVAARLDSIVKARGGTGAPTGADSATLRATAQGIVDRIVNPPTPGNAPRPGPVQCHDITVYPALGVAGGACAGYGVLLDIRDPAHPRRLAAVADSNFAFWHSATFKIGRAHV